MATELSNHTDDPKGLVFKIKEAQKAWADAVISIGKAAKENRVVEELTDKLLDNCYDFGVDDSIQFKPTVASKQPIRVNREETRSYFIGGVVSEDKGFAITTPWKQIDFEVVTREYSECIVLAMGRCSFTDYEGGRVEADYTFGYREDSDGRLRIILHHSSLPHEPFSKDWLYWKEHAKNDVDTVGYRMILPGEFDYERARQISNSFFNPKPAAVAFPKTTRQVSNLMRQYVKKNSQSKTHIPLRICSGGHHHEGMSMADKAMVIRLSDFDTIEYVDGMSRAWIPAGMKLGKVYAELGLHGKLIPGGGCMNVNVGGLTQGGGWGMNSRKYGLSCDVVSAVEMVLANGDTVRVTPTENAELFWAVRGGGGGNFGVVTRFLFDLFDKSEHLWQFRFGWKLEHAEEVMKRWMTAQKEFPEALTSFLRITVRSTEPDKIKGPSDFPIYCSGNYHGTKDDLQRILETGLIKDFNPDSVPEYRDLNERKHKVGNPAGGNLKSEESREMLADLKEIAQYIDIVDYFDSNFQFSSRLLAEQVSIHVYDRHNIEPQASGSVGEHACFTSPPGVNCSAPHPHKVSSAFSAGTGDTYYEQVAKKVKAYIDETKDQCNRSLVRTYMTFHAMGGVISQGAHPGSFAFSDREFLMQFQAWWNYRDDENREKCRKDIGWQQEYIDWVNNFRGTLAKDNLVEGAFLNFVDKDLVKDISSPKGRLKLLKHYHGHNLDKLREIKTKVDPDNVFDFEMGVLPLEEQ